MNEKQHRYQTHRMAYLPRQYEATKRKLAALEKEAKRLGVELPQ